MRASAQPEATAPERPESRWLVRPYAPPGTVARLVRELGVPPLLASVLWARGMRDDALGYLQPPLELTAIPDLHAAAARLEEALKGRKRIVIHGDYDADGISGTALLTLGLRALGARVTPFIPDRLSDGYGVSPRRVEEHAANADLFLTVDCGITNLAELEALQRSGVEVIVSDHHQPGERLPDCLLVHPKMSPLARRGLPELTGAGVAYHLLWALHERLGLEAPLEYSDIAAIGTIADVAPLLGENRALVRAGLERLADSRWPGLRATLSHTGLSGAVSARHVAFVLAPRLNAAGRLGEADLGLELLTTASERRARELAAYLDARNEDRRRIQDEMLRQALEMVDPQAPALVVADDGWHPGVMGIVASKLLERFYKPVFIIAQGKGSVRSTPGISAVDALRAAAPWLERFGGHEQAAGFALMADAAGGFREAIEAYVARFPRPVPTVLADVVATAEQVDEDLVRALDELEPFGEGHPPPLFALAGRLEAARAVGREAKTLQLQVGGVRGVAWRRGHLAAGLERGGWINVAASFREVEWQGKRRLEFVAEDLRQASALQLDGEADSSPLVSRGPAPQGQPLHRLSELPEEAQVAWLRRLPLDPDPIRASAPLRQLLARGVRLYLDLDEAGLAEAESAVAQLPTVADVRRAFLSLQRGQPLQLAPAKHAAVLAILEELELVDPAGRARRGQKRDPYSSDTLLLALLERYRVASLLAAYRALDDRGFSQAARTLLQP